LENSGDDFVSEASSWTASSLRGSTVVSTCNGTSLVGGYKILGGVEDEYFQRIYTGLPAHNITYFTMTFWLIDSWDYPKDSFQISFDSEVLDGWSIAFSKFESNLCGGSKYNDLPNMKVYGQISHSGASLVLRVISQLDESSSNEAFGFRDVNLIFANTTTTGNVEEMCGLSPIDLQQYGDQCECSEGKYPIDTGSIKCESCDSSCESCFGPSSRECYECSSGYSWTGAKCIPCDNSCGDCSGPFATQCTTCKSGLFLYLNSTCIEGCNAPFIQSSSGGVLYCDAPCNSTQYTYPNGTCSETCTFPLQLTVYLSVDFCINLCNSTGQYLYWNGSCLEECEYPYVQRTDELGKYCELPCSYSQYLYWNGTCSSFCPSPLAQTQYGSVRLCEYTCREEGSLYWDKTCNANCPSALVLRIEGDKEFCRFPCKNNQFLYWNGTCSMSCNSPLVAARYKDRKFCQYPCESSSDFVYPNGSCSAYCLLPMRSIVSTVNYCNYPCSNPNDFLLLADNSCIKSCPGPLVSQEIDGIKSCFNPCNETGNYLFWNSTCIDSCPWPLSITSDETGKYCLSPCATPRDFYVLETNECSRNCTYPNIIQVQDLYLSCLISKTNETDFTDDTSQSTNSNSGSNIPTIVEANVNDVVSGGAVISAVASSHGDSSTIIMVLVMKLMRYIEFLDINFPPKLRDMLDNQSRAKFFLNFGPGPTDSLEGKFEKYSLPAVFEQYGLYSSFLLNIWNVVMSLFILVGVMIVMKVLERIFDEGQNTILEMILRKLGVIFVWNIVLMLIASNIDEIVLYSSLDWRTLHINSFGEFMSFVLSLVMIVVGTATGVGSFLLLRKLSLATTTSDLLQISKKGHQDKYKGFAKRWDGFRLLWGDFKENSKAGQAFFALYLLRTAVFYMIASWLYPFPLVQTILYVVLSAGTIVYISLVQPFRMRINFIQALIYELILFAINFNILLLAILDVSNTSAVELRFFIGDVVVFFHLCISLTSGASLAAKLYFWLKKVCINFEKQRKKGKIKLSRLFFEAFESSWTESRSLRSSTTSINLISATNSVTTLAFKKNSIFNESSLSPESKSGLSSEGDAIFKKRKTSRSKSIFAKSRVFDFTEENGRTTTESLVSVDKAAGEFMMMPKKKESKFDFNLTESSDEDLAITPLNAKKLSRERSSPDPERNTPSPDRKKSSSENEDAGSGAGGGGRVLTISDLDPQQLVNVKSRSSIISMTTVADFTKRNSLEGDSPNQSPISESQQELGSTLNVLKSPNSNKRSSTLAKQQGGGLDLQAILDQPELEIQSPTLGFVGRLKSLESVVKKKSLLSEIGASEARLTIPTEEDVGENGLRTKIRLLFNQDTLPTFALIGDPQLPPVDNHKEMSPETGRQKFIRPRRIGRRNSQELKNPNPADLDPSEVQRKIRTVIHIRGKDDAVLDKLEHLKEQWANHLANSSRQDVSQNSGAGLKNQIVQNGDNDIEKEATGLPLLIVRRIEDISPGRNNRESPESLNESCVFE